MNFYRKTYANDVHGPINWFPVIVILCVVLNVVILLGGTYIAYDDTSINQETIDQHLGSGYKLIAVNSDAGQIHIVLLEDDDGHLYYVGFHEIELLNRFLMLDDEVTPVVADGSTNYEVKCFAGSAGFSVTKEKMIVSGVSSENMNFVQRYFAIAVILFGIEFLLLMVINYLLKKGRR